MSVNGLNIHYLDWGGDRTKRPLFLLHGIGGHAHQFDELAPHVTDDRHVVALDARGCGDSDWSREWYSVQSFAADVAQFALATGLYPFDYYGHSQGSRVGMVIGGFYGHLVDHLVLGDYGPLPDPSPGGRETVSRRAQAGATERPRGFFSPEMAFEWHKMQDESASDDQVWRTVRHTCRTNWDGILVTKTDPDGGFWGERRSRKIRSCGTVSGRFPARPLCSEGGQQRAGPGPGRQNGRHDSRWQRPDGGGARRRVRAA